MTYAIEAIVLQVQGFELCKGDKLCVNQFIQQSRCEVDRLQLRHARQAGNVAQGLEVRGGEGGEK